jgi:predicted MFS family arabinose efflux permease
MAKMNPFLVFLLIIGICAGLYIGLTAMSTNNLIEQGEEEGGIGGIFTILLSSSLASQIWIIPVIIIGIVLLVLYALNLRHEKKSQKWRR